MPGKESKVHTGVDCKVERDYRWDMVQSAPKCGRYFPSVEGTSQVWKVRDDNRTTTPNRNFVPPSHTSCRRRQRWAAPPAPASSSPPSVLPQRQRAATTAAASPVTPAHWRRYGEARRSISLPPRRSSRGGSLRMWWCCPGVGV
eukprot:365234-Chlamydomonas_euryale.AAC.2